MRQSELDRDSILAQITGGTWKDIIIQDTVDSTNSLALCLISEAKISSGSVVIADQQTAGKGRLGRIWLSPPGMNIYMSMVIRPGLEQKELTMLTLLAGVSSVEALNEVCHIPVSIKWPNDLIVSGKKLGGILTEIRTAPDSRSTSVIGIGINLNMPQDVIPDEISSIATSIMIETGRSYSRNEIISKILASVEKWLSIIKKEGKEQLLGSWRAYSSTLGKNVKATTGDGSFEGVAEDIDENGMLLLKMPSGRTITITAGDITLLR